jgi:hypothetical protein
MLLGSRKLSHSLVITIAHNQDRKSNSAQLYMFYISHDRTSAQAELFVSQHSSKIEILATPHHSGS